MDAAVSALHTRGRSRIVVLPLFLSDDHPRLRLAKTQLGQTDGLIWAKPFGESYLAAEVLADRLRTLDEPEKHHTVLVAYGATTDENRMAMQADLDRLMAHASDGLSLRSTKSLVWYEYGIEGEETKRKEVTKDLIKVSMKRGGTAIVPFNLAMKLDSMMSMSGFMQKHLPKSVQFIQDEVLPHPAVGVWLTRELQRPTLTMDDLGVVFLAHGADFDWNETMRQAAAPITDKYKVEFAFSMADKPVVERAIHKLEARGAKAIVIVRVFGMSASFLSSVHRMLGHDVEHAGHHHTHSGGHAHHSMGGPGPRIRTAAITATSGGIDDHPLFAEALLERAKALSKDSAKETIVVVAHGSGSDTRNQAWKETLNSVAAHMGDQGGDEFRAIHTGTWREDWPDKRKVEVAAIRKHVEDGLKDGGRVIVIPARTTLQGPEAKLLKGLEYTLGTGFAPSPQFTRWVETHIERGAATLGLQRASAANPAPHRSDDTHHD